MCVCVCVCVCLCVCVCVCVCVDSAVNEHLGIYSWGKVTCSSLISAVAQVGLRVPTPRAEEVLSVHLAWLQEVADYQVYSYLQCVGVRTPSCA